jgi:hypothetical protein
MIAQRHSSDPVVAASMFFKSCNCNSSIATRVGFAVRVFDTFAHLLVLICLQDHLSAQLHVGMAHEDAACNQDYREVELRLH